MADSGDMVRVFSAQHLAYVHPVRAALVTAGIPAEVRNTLLSGVAGEVPYTETFPEVWVRTEHADEARALIEQLLRHSELSGTEACPSCGTEVESQFARCWSCGASMVDGATPGAEMRDDGLYQRVVDPRWGGVITAIGVAALLGVALLSADWLLSHLPLVLLIAAVVFLLGPILETWAAARTLGLHRHIGFATLAAMVLRKAKPLLLLQLQQQAAQANVVLSLEALEQFARQGGDVEAAVEGIIYQKEHNGRDVPLEPNLIGREQTLVDAPSEP